MIVALLNLYLVILFILVKTKIVPFNLFWKCSPLIVLLLLMFGLFIPMGWGAPQGPSLVVRNSVQIVPNVAGEVTEVPVEPNKPLKAGDVLFKIDPVPYQAQVDSIAAQVKFEELRLSQMTQLTAAATPAVRLTSSNARPMSTSSRGSFWARNITSTRPSFAHRPTVTSPMWG